MKAVMISIQPKWCELIANGEKTIEVRKTRPKIETPFKVYIYCTKIKDKKRYLDEFDIPKNTRKWLGNGKVIGEFVCDKIDKIECCSEQFNMITKDASMTLDDIMEYCNGEDIYAWHISDLKIYDEPKEVEEFYSYAETKRQGYKYCKRKGCLSPEDCKYYCISKNCCWRLTRPPQSWQYCEELEEK